MSEMKWVALDISQKVIGNNDEATFKSDTH